MKAKTYLQPLLLFMAALVCLPSCLKDDSETEGTEYCYISGFTLGTLKRTLHTVNKAGNDSTYTTSFSGSLYNMSIDQKSQIIENLDSLPYETSVSAVLATVSYQGVLVYKYEGDSIYHTYSSSDSINFERPVDFSVYPTSGSTERHYKVKVNVHQQNGKLCSWAKQTDSEVLQALTERNMVARNGQLLMMGRTADGEVMCAQRSAITDEAWTLSSTSGAGAADITTLHVMGNSQLVMGTTTGGILTSEDGIGWTVTSDVHEGRSLLGVSVNRIYVAQDGLLLSSGDMGATWSEESLDTEASMLPEKCASLVYAKQDNGRQRLILTGVSSATNDDLGVVWGKSWGKDDKESTNTWMFYPHTDGNKLQLPKMDPMYVFGYDDKLICLGGKTADGNYEALDTVLYSPDYGVTWQPSDAVLLPSDLKGTKEAIAATIDENNFIWLVVGKETWRGRQNRMGFAKQDK